MSDPVDLDAIGAAHRSTRVQVGSMTHGGGPEYAEYCRHCGGWWPCDVSRLAAELGATRVTIAEQAERLAAVAELCDDYRSNVDPKWTQARVAEIFRAVLASSSAGQEQP